MCLHVHVCVFAYVCVYVRVRSSLGLRLTEVSFVVPRLHPTGKIDDQIQSYIGIKTLISAGVGFLVYLVLGPMLGVNLAHIFGVLTFFFNFIPNVGAVIATGAFPLRRLLGCVCVNVL